MDEKIRLVIVLLAGFALGTGAGAIVMGAKPPKPKEVHIDVYLTCASRVSDCVGSSLTIDTKPAWNGTIPHNRNPGLTLSFKEILSECQQRTFRLTYSGSALFNDEEEKTAVCPGFVYGVTFTVAPD